jgi:hypothetical protein
MGKGATRVGRPKAPADAPAGPPRLGPLAEFIGFHLRLAQEASFQAFARRVRDLDLRPGRFAALALIGGTPGISQAALGRASGRDKSTLTPALADLARRGLISRRPLDARPPQLHPVLDAERRRRARRTDGPCEGP